MGDKSEQYKIPIVQRAARSARVALRGFAFVVFLLSSMILINSAQFLALPLAILPPTRGLYTAMIRSTKAAFGVMLASSSSPSNWPNVDDMSFRFFVLSSLGRLPLESRMILLTPNQAIAGSR